MEKHFDQSLYVQASREETFDDLKLNVHNPIRNDSGKEAQNFLTGASVNDGVEKDPSVFCQDKIDLHAKLNFAYQKEEDLKRKHEELKQCLLAKMSELDESRKCKRKKNSHSDVASQCDPDQIQEMSLISLLSVFLFKNPGVDVEYIYSNLNESIQTSEEEIENTLKKFPNFFKKSSPNEDSSKKWSCISIPPNILTDLLELHH